MRIAILERAGIAQVSILATASRTHWRRRRARYCCLRATIFGTQISNRPNSKAANLDGFASIVFLVADRCPVPSYRCQQFPIGSYHFVQSTDVGAHVGTILSDSRHVLLHIAAQALPVCGAAAQCGQVMKVRMLTGETLELVVVVDVFFAAAAKQKPKLLSQMA